MENENKKQKFRPMIPLVATLGSVLTLGTYLWVNATYSEKRLFEERKTAIIHEDEKEKTYLGKTEYFGRGAERTIYVDKIPFGSLDYVIEEIHSDTQKISETKRQPTGRDLHDFWIVTNAEAQVKNLPNERKNQ